MTATGTKLIDGMLHREPGAGALAPARCWAGLLYLLRMACGPPGLRELRVMIAPLDAAQPDRSTARCSRTSWSPRCADLGPQEPAGGAAARGRGALAVHRGCYDRNTKTRGTTSGWACRRTGSLDPTAPVRAHSRSSSDDSGVRYQVAHVVGDEEFVATRPFPVTVVPARLLDGLRPR